MVAYGIPNVPSPMDWMDCGQTTSPGPGAGAVGIAGQPAIVAGGCPDSAGSVPPPAMSRSISARNAASSGASSKPVAAAGGGNDLGASISATPLLRPIWVRGLQYGQVRAVRSHPTHGVRYGESVAPRSQGMERVHNLMRDRRRSRRLLQVGLRQRAGKDSGGGPRILQRGLGLNRPGGFEGNAR